MGVVNVWGGERLGGERLTIQFNHIKCLVPNCPGAKLSGAKLSWCQIVLVPNCSLLLSWCQIVRFYHLGAKLSLLLSWCQIVLRSKSGTIFFISNIYIPKMKNKKKRSFI